MGGTVFPLKAHPFTGQPGTVHVTLNRGWGTFFSAKGHLDVSSIIHGPYTTMHVEISRPESHGISSPTCGCLGKAGPNDFALGGHCGCP